MKLTTYFHQNRRSQMAKKERRYTVYGYTVRLGKDPNDPDSKRAWRVYEGDEPHPDTSARR